MKLTQVAPQKTIALHLTESQASKLSDILRHDKNRWHGRSGELWDSGLKGRAKRAIQLRDEAASLFALVTSQLRANCEANQD